MIRKCPWLYESVLAYKILLLSFLVIPSISSAQQEMTSDTLFLRDGRKVVGKVNEVNRRLVIIDIRSADGMLRKQSIMRKNIERYGYSLSKFEVHISEMEGKNDVRPSSLGLYVEKSLLNRYVDQTPEYSNRHGLGGSSSKLDLSYLNSSRDFSIGLFIRKNFSDVTAIVVMPGIEYSDYRINYSNSVFSWVGYWEHTYDTANFRSRITNFSLPILLQVRLDKEWNLAMSFGLAPRFLLGSKQSGYYSHTSIDTYVNDSTAFDVYNTEAAYDSEINTEKKSRTDFMYCIGINPPILQKRLRVEGIFNYSLSSLMYVPEFSRTSLSLRLSYALRKGFQ